MSTELEVKFFDIDPVKIKQKLTELGAVDHGEKFLKEAIFYDQALTWIKHSRFVRVRDNGEKVVVTYKDQSSIDQGEVGVFKAVPEINMRANTFNEAVQFLEFTGMRRFRYQEKTRHTFAYKGATIDIDTWPSVPTYLEIEAQDKNTIKTVAADLGLVWSTVFYGSAKYFIENSLRRNKAGQVKNLTFDKGIEFYAKDELNV